MIERWLFSPKHLGGGGNKTFHRVTEKYNKFGGKETFIRKAIKATCSNACGYI